MSTQVARDDVVRTHAEGEANEREPLLVLEPLQAFLDERGLGSGELHVEPVGLPKPSRPASRQSTAWTSTSASTSSSPMRRRSSWLSSTAGTELVTTWPSTRSMT